MSEIDYERKDYKVLAKEFGCAFSVGKYGFIPKNIWGRFKYKVLGINSLHGNAIVRLDGWITNPNEVERIIRERGMEL